MARTAILLPGANYGPHQPTLAYPGAAASLRGAELVAMEWSDTAAVVALDGAGRVERISAEVDARIVPGTRPLIIGRSLGSYASPLIAQRDLPAIWINPVLTEPLVVEGIRRASAPVLLVGGSRDPMWDDDIARSIADRVLQIDGADHGMMRPGALASSAAALGELVTAVEAFLDDLDADDWPS